jgi:hypothetical protein
MVAASPELVQTAFHFVIMMQFSVSFCPLLVPNLLVIRV